MNDLILQYSFQFGAITAAAMGLSEFATLPLGKTSSEPGKGTRKRWNALLWSTGLGTAGYFAGFVQMPGETTMSGVLGCVVMGCVCTGAAHAIVTGKKKIKGEQ